MIPSILLLLLVLAAYFIFFRGLRKVLALSGGTRQRAVFGWTLACVLGWAALLAGLSLAGFFADFLSLPPRLPFAMLLPLPVVLAVIFSRSGKDLLQVLPPQWPVYFQSFRIGVELVLWFTYLSGSIPALLTFEGRNFDIVSGLLALPVAYYALVTRRWPAWTVVMYNIVGLGLLLNTVIIAFLSMPTPLRIFHEGTGKPLMVYFPWIYLPGLLVPLAYTMHIFSLRQVALRGAVGDLSPAGGAAATGK